MTKKGEVVIPPYLKTTVTLIVLCLLLGLYFFRHYLPLWRQDQRQTNRLPSVVVEIEGEVSNPGVYFFSDIPTIEETLALCGEVMDSAKIIYPEPGLKIDNGTLLRINKTQEGVEIGISPMTAKKKFFLASP